MKHVEYRLMRAFAVATACFGLLLAAPKARAEQAEQPQGPPSVPSTVQGLAEQIVGQTGRLMADMDRPTMDLGVILRVDLGSAVQSDRAAAFATLLRQLLLGSVSRSQGLRSVAVPPFADTAQDSDQARGAAAASGFELLLWAEVSLVANHLVVEAMLFETVQHLWRDAVEPEQQVLGQAFARHRVNAELRHHLGPLPPQPLSLREIPLGARGFLDMAVADVDGDDLSELLLLRRQSLEVRRFDGTEAPVVAEHSLRDLGIAPTRSRDTVGSLALSSPDADSHRSIAIRTSEHAGGIIVGFDGLRFTRLGLVADYPVGFERGQFLCSTIQPGLSDFQTAPAPCDGLAPAQEVTAYYNAASVEIDQPTAPPAVAMAKVLNDGRAVFRWNGQRVGALRSFGTAVGITDMDDDGTAEVLLSSNREPGQGDILTLLRMNGQGLGQGRETFGPVVGSVWVAGAGDVDNDGFRELVALSESPTTARLLVVE